MSARSGRAFLSVDGLIERIALHRFAAGFADGFDEFGLGAGCRSRLLDIWTVRLPGRAWVRFRKLKLHVIEENVGIRLGNPD